MKSSQIRLIILCSALAATIVAIFYPLPENAPTTAETKQSSVVAKVTPAIKEVDQRLPKDSDDEQEVNDPFAPRGWQPVPVIINQTVAPVTAAIVPVEVAPTGPPPIPYRFLGKLVDGDDLVIYLGRGEQTIIAKVGETLEGTYKVLSISDKNIELEHLPTNEKQSLSLE